MLSWASLTSVSNCYEAWYGHYMSFFLTLWLLAICKTTIKIVLFLLSSKYCISGEVRGEKKKEWKQKQILSSMMADTRRYWRAKLAIHKKWTAENKNVPFRQCRSYLQKALLPTGCPSCDTLYWSQRVSWGPCRRLHVQFGVPSFWFCKSGSWPPVAVDEAS